MTLKLGYTVETTPKNKQAIVELWAVRHNATRQESKLRNVSLADKEYTLGGMTQDERYEYETSEKSFPYTLVEYSIGEPTEQARKEFFLVRGFLADNKTADELDQAGY